MKKGILAVVLLLISMGVRVSEAETIRYDFQIDAGEGTQELYRIDIDLAQKKGALCFLNTGSSGIPEETLVLIRKGALWSKQVDLQKEDHGCFKFDLYDPLGWFYSPPFKYSNQEYRLFFIGTVKKEAIKGTVYQFINMQEGSKHYRMTEEREVSATGIIIKK
jgi:hypothetical protein